MNSISNKLHDLGKSFMSLSLEYFLISLEYFLIRKMGKLIVSTS